MTRSTGLSDSRAKLETALAQCEPLSPAAQVIAVGISFTEFIDAVLSGAPALRIGHMLRARDLARIEQEWVQALLRDQSPPDDLLRPGPAAPGPAPAD